MSSALKNLSEYDAEGLSAAGLRIGIVVADWNRQVTHALLEGALSSLKDLGADPQAIKVSHVPGSYELPLAAKWMAESEKPDAVICLGCVIQGETRHFDFICKAVSTGLMDLNLQYGIPFVFGVLTPENQDQALARAGGKHGNKGIEAAVTAIKMCQLKSR